MLKRNEEAERALESFVDVSIAPGMNGDVCTAVQQAQARNAKTDFLDGVNGCSAKVCSTTDLLSMSRPRASPRTPLYAAIDPRLAPSEVMSNAFRIWRAKSQYSAAAMRSMKNPCFSSESSQRRFSLNTFFERFADFEVASIVINKTRVSVEKAKASRRHFSPYDAATPSLLLQPTVAINAEMDSAVSDAKGRCSRVMGEGEVL